MAVPVLTIPEGAFDPAGYTNGPKRRRSRLLAYLIRLTNGSAGLLTVIYLLGYFVIKPLLETKASRRLELLEKCRFKLRDVYLSLIDKVSYIPIVAVNKNGKLCADAVVQTEDTSFTKEREQARRIKEENDVLGQTRLASSLSKLSRRLTECTAFLVLEMPHYKIVDAQVKEFQSKADLVYFNSNDLFSVQGAVDTSANGIVRRKNLALEARNEIRSIKGLYMSGQA